MRGRPQIRGAVRQEFCGLAVRERAQGHGGEFVGVQTRPVALARGSHDHHRLRADPARHEGQDAGGGVVEPLGVVDQEQHRRDRGRVGQEVEDRQADEEDIGDTGLGVPESGVQGLPVRDGEFSGSRGQRAQDELQTGVGDVALRLDTAGAQDPVAEFLGEGGGLGEQRRLSDAGGPADQHRAPVAPRLGQQSAQQIQLIIPTDELHVPPISRVPGLGLPGRSGYSAAADNPNGRPGRDGLALRLSPRTRRCPRGSSARPPGSRRPAARRRPTTARPRRHTCAALVDSAALRAAADGRFRVFVRRPAVTAPSSSVVDARPGGRSRYGPGQGNDVRAGACTRRTRSRPPAK